MAPNIPINKVPAVLFDFDGVICNTEPLHIRSWQILFAQMGLEIPEAELTAGIGITDITLLRSIFAQHNISADPSEWQLEKRTIYLKLLEESVEAFPGAAALVRRLHENWPLAIASSAWRSAIETAARKLSILQYFRVVVSKEDVTAHKPDPEVFLKAAAKLGVEPGGCAVIEDSPAGIQAARAAGMRCIAVTNSFPPTQLLAADLIIDSLEETERILAFLHGPPAQRLSGPPQR